MRPQANELQRVGSRFGLDEDKIWTPMTIAIIFPFSGQGVIPESGLKHRVVGDL